MYVGTPVRDACQRRLPSVGSPPETVQTLPDFLSTGFWRFPWVRVLCCLRFRGGNSWSREGSRLTRAPAMEQIMWSGALWLWTLRVVRVTAVATPQCIHVCLASSTTPDVQHGPDFPAGASCSATLPSPKFTLVAAPHSVHVNGTRLVAAMSPSPS